MTSRNDFETAPSIVQLFQSAKKLLALQPRVENRNLRKENSRMQKNLMSSELYGNNNRVLELLSPLSIDEIKSSPPYAPKQPKNYQQNNGITEITPASVNDSPPTSATSKSDGWTNNSWHTSLPNQSIQKDHMTTINSPSNTIQPYSGIPVLYPTTAYKIQPHIFVIQEKKQKTKRLGPQSSMLQL